MQQLHIGPVIHYFDTFKQFNEEFKLGKGDVLVTNEWMYKPYVEPLGIKDMPVIFQEKYGKGEPTDEMIEAMMEELAKYDCKRLIAFGGGTIIDICKIMSLKKPQSVAKVFRRLEPIEKEKKLVIIPTTCGTGSEVSNVAVALLVKENVKLGFNADETYADYAVLIPESLEGLPDYVFSTSSIDALVHATESYLSPKATPYTEMYSLAATELILKGFKSIIAAGGNTAANRKPFLKDFAIASNYGGISFGNAGTGAVHALAYSIGGAFHVPHGESNYVFFTEVFKLYQKKNPTGKIAKLNALVAGILDCDPDKAWDEVEALLGKILSKKSLHEYGTTEAQKAEFTQSTIDNQQRLLGNNYVPLSYDDLYGIFERLF